ncbi:toprim domain-containing protein [Sphingobacterium hungaricum]|uniref:Molecular chaperone TorD n=1 Tax=Sphingobacterium hungaricum TaxID=2082723 RepID=A0A928V2A5_9SPHI|nr:toprim domain-containing protein [Sphingobacterium hungaricum]MBE8714829.1 molecular chaperone TorD [Sphingobacterium hungaricum]
MTQWTNIQQMKQQASIVELLSRLGHDPAYRSGKELFYKSMLREEKTPSLCVNDSLNVWYDHGGQNVAGIKGGNIIDFALAYWYPASFNEVVEKIKNIMAITINSPHKISAEQKRPRKLTSKLSNYSIERIQDLGHNFGITRYLQSRSIWDQAQDRIKEVYYTINSGSKRGRQFFSAGWQNDAGGWELRNRISDRDFKSCIGRKAITTISGNSDSLCLFEGYMDYLSWLKEHPDATDTVLVLNSVNLLDTAILQAKDFASIHVFFDRDPAGESALSLLKSELPQAIDCSANYRGYKDYNEMIMNRPKQSILYEEKNIYEKIMATYRR